MYKFERLVSLIFFSIILLFTSNAQGQLNADAKYKMGIKHLDGVVVRQNNDQAQRWFSKAAQQGHIKAKYQLQQFQALAILKGSKKVLVN